MQPGLNRRPAPAPAPAALLVVAIVLLALNLRGPIVAVTPVLDVIGADLQASAATVALLVSLPVLCFGVLTPPASYLLARAGVVRGVLVALAVLLAGIALRSAGGLGAALAGTVLIGAAITVGNVAVPVVIGRDLPRRANVVLGLYTSALNAGSMITLSLTAPLDHVLGWRAALLVWGGLVVLSALAWWAATRGRPGTASATAPGEPATAAGPGGPKSGAADPDGADPDGAAPAGAAPGGPDRGGAGPGGTVPAPRDGAATADWWRRPLLWGLSIAFAGNAFAYYALTAWLPLMLHDLLGMDPAAAGAASSIFQIAAIAGAVGVPLLLRYGGPVPALAAVVGAWIVLVLGLLLAPGGWPVWCALGGGAQGGGITAIFAMVVRGARDLTENRRMSATVQGVGYLAAATGPSVLGALHEGSASWDVPLLVVLGSIVVLAVAGISAAAGVRRASPG